MHENFWSAETPDLATFKLYFVDGFFVQPGFGDIRSCDEKLIINESCSCMFWVISFWPPFHRMVR